MYDGTANTQSLLETYRQICLNPDVCMVVARRIIRKGIITRLFSINGMDHATICIARACRSIDKLTSISSDDRTYNANTIHVYLVSESDTFERYSGYTDNEQGFGSGLGVMLYLIGAIWLLYWHHGSKTNTFFILNNAIAVSLIPFVYSIPLVARVSYYFKLYSLVILPLLFFKKGDFVGKFIFCVIVYIIVSGYSAWMVFRSVSG